jgi:hypothetical protein
VVSVDPSGSMDEEMDAMADEVFGGPNGFARALLNISGGIEDYRVGTIDACPTPANFHTSGQGGACNFASGEVWIEGTPDRNEEEVIAEFECVGDILRGSGSNDCSGDNDDEQPASAAIAALTPPFINEQNAGFLRDDALLVVIAITDEDEQPTPNRSAAELYADLIGIKGGVNNMVFVGIGGGPPSGCNPGAYGKADYAEKLHQLSNLFIAQNRGVWWDLCDGNLGDGLSAAIAVIEEACNDFEIPVD